MALSRTATLERQAGTLSRLSIGTANSFHEGLSLLCAVRSRQCIAPTWGLLQGSWLPSSLSTCLSSSTFSLGSTHSSSLRHSPRRLLALYLCCSSRTRA